MCTIHFLNVRNGDCSIIQHNSGRVSVIDICCGNNGLYSSCESVSGNYNQKSKPTNPIDYIINLKINNIQRFILTHPDMDHMDGINTLFSQFHVSCFWDTENSKKVDDIGLYNIEDWKKYLSLRQSRNRLCIKDGDNIHKFKCQDQYIDKDGLQVLCPTNKLIANADKTGDYNNASYVILYCECGKKILFAGDSGKAEWDYLLKKHTSELKNIDVLIAPHHGRKTGGNNDYLSVLKPKLSLLGNARSELLGYDFFNSKDLLHFTNNQGGAFVLDINNNRIDVYCSNCNFAEKFHNDYNEHRSDKYRDCRIENKTEKSVSNLVFSYLFSL